MRNWFVGSGMADNFISMSYIAFMIAVIGARAGQRKYGAIKKDILMLLLPVLPLIDFVLNVSIKQREPRLCEGSWSQYLTIMVSSLFAGNVISLYLNSNIGGFVCNSIFIPALTIFAGLLFSLEWIVDELCHKLVFLLILLLFIVSGFLCAFVVVSFHGFYYVVPVLLSVFLEGLYFGRKMALLDPNGKKF